MTNRKNNILWISLNFLVFILSACNSADQVNYEVPEEQLSEHPNDIYIRENILNNYGTAIRWRWDDRFLSKGQTASAIDEDLVIPVIKLIENLWINPFIVLSDDSETFIREYIPKEIVFLGSYIYNNSGTRIIAYEESGSRLSLSNLNVFDLEDKNWILQQLISMHHEFNHILLQNYELPAGFNTISDKGYLGQGWSNGVSYADAIKRGMLTPYATNNEYEDFCQLVSLYLVEDPESFNSLYLEYFDCSEYSDQELCEEINAGRILISQKLELAKNFYSENFNINLEDLRDTIQSKIQIIN